MDVDEAREFLRSNHRAVLGTYHPDGRMQLSPVTVGVDAEGRAVISTRETAVKLKNLRRDPRASLCVMNDGFYGKWLLIEGKVSIVPLPEAMELLVTYYRDVRGGEHPDWDDYRAAMEREQRVIVQITLERVGPTYHG
jgi:PPOX class probable F420-dependent enzyme